MSFWRNAFERFICNLIRPSPDDHFKGYRLDACNDSGARVSPTLPYAWTMVTLYTSKETIGSPKDAHVRLSSVDSEIEEGVPAHLRPKKVMYFLADDTSDKMWRAKKTTGVPGLLSTEEVLKDDRRAPKPWEECTEDEDDEGVPTVPNTPTSPRADVVSYENREVIEISFI